MTALKAQRLHRNLVHNQQHRQDNVLGPIGDPGKIAKAIYRTLSSQACEVTACEFALVSRSSSWKRGRRG